RSPHACRTSRNATAAGDSGQSGAWVSSLSCMVAAQFGQHRGGGDVAVPFGAAAVRGFREDGRGHTANLVIRQGMFRAQHRGSGCETGCKLHGLSPDKGFAVETPPDS